jgi:alpha-L-fucosidase 2
MASETLWYDTPATCWQQGVPIGNGRIGAVVQSDLNCETWRLTEITFWSGRSERSPVDDGDRKKILRGIQERYFTGDFAGGKKLAEEYLQPPKHNFGTNLTVANVSLHFDHPADAHASKNDFVRVLSLDRATATAEYKINGHRYHRETWISHPQQVLVSRLSTDAPDGISLRLCIESENDQFGVTPSNEALEFDAHAVETIHSDGTCGVRGRGSVSIQSSPGSSVQRSEKHMQIANASSVVIMVAFNTDFRRGADEQWASLSATQLRDAQQKTYEQLLSDHIHDHQRLYRRVRLQLGGPQGHQQHKLPTDQRRVRFQASRSYEDDPDLFALFFQYGRYLTIAGTRADSPLPLHLQGLWNDGEANAMNWSCDYHLDINTQMNYWPTESANLSDCQRPLMNFIADLANAGQSTAAQFYGCAGWVAHVFTNVWGFTDPGWETSWGLNVTGGLWMATHMIEHYEYTLDRAFLEGQAYPVLKQAALFFLEYMTTEPRTGYLVTGPSVSPENSFFPDTADRDEQHLSLGPTVDIVLIRDLFRFCITAARELCVDAALTQRLTAALTQLPPFQIGRNGQLQEWLEDYEEAQPDHRHLSHTIALCRSDQISARHTPDLAAATRTTLMNRQSRAELEDIEFTAAMLGLNFARLNDGESALRQLGHLIGELCFDNLLTYSKPGIAGAETNIFIFDGNMGGAALVGEMLLRSRSTGEMDLLPALPAAWCDGSVKGLRATGNMVVDLEWKDGKLVEAMLRAYSPGRKEVYYGRHRREVNFTTDQVVRLDGSLTVIEP